MDSDDKKDPLNAALDKLDSANEGAVETETDNFSQNEHIPTESFVEPDQIKPDVILQEKDLTELPPPSFFDSIKNQVADLKERYKEERKSTSTDEEIDLEKEIEDADIAYESSTKEIEKKGKYTPLIKFALVATFIGVGVFVSMNEDPFPPTIDSPQEKKVVTSEAAVEDEALPISTLNDFEELTMDSSLTSPTIPATTDYENESQLLKEANVSIKTDVEEVKAVTQEEDLPPIVKAEEPAATESSLFDIPLEVAPASQIEELTSKEFDGNPAAVNTVPADEMQKEIDALRQEVSALSTVFKKHTTKKKTKHYKPKISVKEIASASKNCAECISHALITYNKKEVFVGDGEHYKGYEISVRGDRVVFTNIKNRSSESFWIKKDVN
jgi:hypothetical protein